MFEENLELYNKFRVCPKEAKKTISAGRLKGMTDINPMWRIKKLTEQFGPCGFGWVLKILNTWVDQGSGGELIANVHIALRVKYNGEWSEPIEGIGGAMMVASEKNGLHTDDECYKKAYTDALSVACKELGIAADVYWDRDPESKYQTTPPAPKKDPMSYEEALAYIYVEGKYPEDPLSAVYKKDIAYINELGKAEDTPSEVMEAICIINEHIKAARANKQ